MDLWRMLARFKAFSNKSNSNLRNITLSGNSKANLLVKHKGPYVSLWSNYLSSCDLFSSIRERLKHFERPLIQWTTESIQNPTGPLDNCWSYGFEEL